MNRDNETQQQSSSSARRNSPDIKTSSDVNDDTTALSFVCYQRCSTCAKARTWLHDHHIPFTERDIKGDNPSPSELEQWWKLSGLPLKRFFNTSGQAYRSMNLKDRLPAMSDAERLQLLGSDGMLVKRPIIVNANTVLVGFRPEEWEESLR